MTSTAYGATPGTGLTVQAAPLDGAPDGAVARRWLGTGVRFPLRPGPGPRSPSGAAGLGWVSGTALVRQAIETILDTEPGERVLLPDFGCGLGRYLMAPNTAATLAAIAHDIADSLTWWEPRIRVTGVQVTPDSEPTLVWVDITYLVIADGRTDNLVYPFYLQ